MPLRIHASTATKDILDTFGSFKFEFRGQIEVKGKGAMKTWWLIGEDKSKAVAPTYEGFQSEHRHAQGNIHSLKSSGSNSATLADRDAALAALASSNLQQQQLLLQQQQQQQQQPPPLQRQSTAQNPLSSAKTANGRRQRGGRRKKSSGANNLHNPASGVGIDIDIEARDGGLDDAGRAGRDRPFKSVGANQAPSSTRFAEDGESGESSSSSRKQSSQLAPDASGIFFHSPTAPSLTGVGSGTGNVSRNASDTSEATNPLLRRQSEDAADERRGSLDFAADPPKPAKKKKGVVLFADDLPPVDGSPSPSPPAATPLLSSASDLPFANNSNSSKLNSNSNSKPPRPSKAVSFLS